MSEVNLHRHVGKIYPVERRVGKEGRNHLSDQEGSQKGKEKYGGLGGVRKNETRDSGRRARSSGGSLQGERELPNIDERFSKGTVISTVRSK